jgi:nicotinate-nucleotide--dimethylbenzimidazole phosphoribosyltransferase
VTSIEARRAIAPIDIDAARSAQARIDALTKPLGSLGRIETLAVQLCGIAGREIRRPYTRKAILIGAGDHGIAEECVSAYPAEVTPQMIGAFLAGHAAINAFARAVDADVYVANFGVRAELAPHPALLDVRVGRGTANFALGDAMEAADVEFALAAGMAAVDQVLALRRFDVLALGDMGIGNTTSAAALVGALTQSEAEAVVGRGTGIDDAGLERKRRVVRAAIAPLAGASWERIARAVGGYEIVGLAGAILGAASRRIPVVLDGYIVAAAALIAQRVAPEAIGYCIAAHRSQEVGHRVALATLGLSALFDFDMRLGEGSGAALALPLIEAATRMYVEMKTFAQAGVSGATAP